MNLIIWINNKILKNVIDTTGTIKDRQEIRFKIVTVENFCGDTSILNVQYTFDRTKEEDFDLSKHNRSEPLVATTVIWRKDETFKLGRQYRQWRLDVSNLWKKKFSTQKSRSIFKRRIFSRKRILYFPSSNIIIFKIYFYPRMRNTFVQILTQSTQFSSFLESKSMELN